MKKNTVKAMLIMAMLAGSVSSFAQIVKTPDQIKKEAENNPLAKKFTERFIAQKGEALAMAKIKGWPVKVENADGSHSELMRLTENGDPIYYRTSNAGSALTSRSNRLYPNGGAGLSLTGAGILAGIWDEDHTRVNHSTFGGRAQAMDGSAPNALHSTHVAGTMIGAGGTGNNANARGIAYEGSLWVYDWNNDIGEMAEACATAEADPSTRMIVSNHSYGLDADRMPANSDYLYGKYIQDSRDVDEIMFDYPKYQVVVAAGNDRGGSANSVKNGNDLLTGMGTSKNALTVAAIHEVANYAAITPAEVGIASFTNFGPTDDFRIKPDIATKGVSVFSSTSTSVASYGSLNGTSMASPGIAGVVMLLQQHYSNLHPDDSGIPNYMNSATVRALMFHTADEIGEEEGPDHMTGWGLVNAEKAALTLSAAGTSTTIVDERTLTSASTYTLNLTSDGVNPLVATIVWTDREGTLSNNAVDTMTSPLVNDLDMRLTSASGEVFFPWTLNRTFSNPIAFREDNAVDTVEKIEIAAPAGNYTLTVNHKRATLNSGRQDYTLVVTGIDQNLAVQDVAGALFNVWPNPASNEINISLNAGTADTAQVNVFDVQGRQVASQKISGAQGVVNVDFLSAGVYMVKVTQGAKTEVKKIIIK